MLIGVIAEELLLPQGVTAVVVDSDIFPSASVFIPGYLLLEGQFDEGDTIYAPFITNTLQYGIFPQLFVDPDVIYAASRGTIVPVLAPSLVVATDLFFSPTVLSHVLGPLLVIDVDLFGGTSKITQGKASINQSTTVDPVFDSDNIFRPIVEAAGVAPFIPQQAALAIETGVIYLNETTRSTTALGGSFVSETAAQTAPALGYLLPAAVAAGDIIFASDMRRPMAPGIFTDADVIYAASRFDRLLPGRLLDNEAVFPGSFGGPTLLPSVVVDADGFFVPVISLVTAMAPSLLSDGDTFFIPLVSIGETLDTVIDVDVVLAPTVLTGSVTAAPAFVGSDDAAVAPVVGSTAIFAPTLFADSDVFFVPAETSIGQPSVVTDTDTFLAPTITQAGFDGTLALDAPIMPATPQPTVIYVEG